MAISAFLALIVDANSATAKEIVISAAYALSSSAVFIMSIISHP